MSGKEPSNGDDSSAGESEGAARHEDGSSSDDHNHGSSDDHEDDEESVGEVRDEEWEESFNRLVEFKSREGHCLVPFRYKHDRKLGKWVAYQRKVHDKVIAAGQKTPAVLEERFRRLDEVGFEWKAKDPRHVPWSQRYGELVDFVSRFGHAQVPIGWKENPKLSNWVSAQRQDYRSLVKGKPSRLTEDRIRQLNEINFIYEARRGGPRRPARATDIVPAEPTPAKGSEQIGASLLRPITRSEVAIPARWDERSSLQRKEANEPILSPLGTVPEFSAHAAPSVSPNSMLQLSSAVQDNQLLAQYLSLQARNQALPFGMNPFGSGLSQLATQAGSASFGSSRNIRTASAELEALQQLNALQRMASVESTFLQPSALQGTLLDRDIPVHLRASLLQRLAPAPTILEESAIPRPTIQVPIVASALQDTRFLSIIPLATPAYLEEAGYEYALVPRSLLQDLRSRQQEQQQAEFRVRDDPARHLEDYPASGYPGHPRPR